MFGLRSPVRRVLEGFQTRKRQFWIKMCCKKNVERVHVIFGPFLNATWSLGEHIWAVFRWLLFWWKSSTSGSHLGILVTSGTVLCTTRDRVSFVENVAGLWTFKVGFVFFLFVFSPSFSLRLLFMGVTNYRIISFSSSKWLPGAHSPITIVPERAKHYYGYHS